VRHFLSLSLGRYIPRPNVTAVLVLDIYETHQSSYQRGTIVPPKLYEEVNPTVMCDSSRKEHEVMLTTSVAVVQAITAEVTECTR
jgi:hypothetical protein